MSHKPRFVYLVENVETGLFKLGRTSAIRDRLVVLRSQCPAPLRPIWFVTTNDEVALESYLQVQWLPHHVEGEWYRLPNEKVAQFRSVTVVNWHGKLPVRPVPSSALEPVPGHGKPLYLVRLGEVIRKLS